MTITMAHGSGGRLTDNLIHGCFARHFSNPVLNGMEDAAVLKPDAGRIAVTTDSFVVTPLFFSGGDIGRLAVCGTVNDLLMRGATPRWLTAGFILETGLDTELLDRAVASMAATAAEAGVTIVAGDTKVVEGNGGLYINTAGIGTLEDGVSIAAANSVSGDAILLSGFLAEHEACILSSRMGIENTIQSDCAPLVELVTALLADGLTLHALRDVTRGGLATVLNELAAASGTRFALDPDVALTSKQVRSFCDILGLDPLYMGNEGKLVLTLPMEQATRALAVMQRSRYGENARLIGCVQHSDSPGVTLPARSGAIRTIPPLLGEGLPRIC